MNRMLEHARHNAEEVATSLTRAQRTSRTVLHSDVIGLAQAQALVALTEAVQELTRTIAEHQ